MTLVKQSLLMSVPIISHLTQLYVRSGRHGPQFPDDAAPLRRFHSRTFDKRGGGDAFLNDGHTGPRGECEQ